MPECEENIIESLVNKGILTQKMGNEIRMMKGFRNIVVHRYGKIDDIVAYKILKERMDDF
jgi:uncharacterized protein YutE (UPF0331/DUF86 family)